MRLTEIQGLRELNYPGNIGMMEMARFYQIATAEQKMQMKLLISQGKTQQAWNFLQEITRMTLQK